MTTRCVTRPRRLLCDRWDCARRDCAYNGRGMIRLTHVAVSYTGARNTGTIRALRDVSLSIPAGEFVFLVGATGAGKSTLLKLLYRDVAATSGTVTVAGMNLSTLKPRDVPALRRRMGIVLQDYGLLPERTVWQNVAFAGEVLGRERRDIRKSVAEALDLVGMASRADARPHELSGGQQQRVALARALLNRPALLFADEPTGNLDPETASGVIDVLAEANRRGTTVVVATHDAANVNRLARRVVIMEDGAVVCDDASGTYPV